MSEVITLLRRAIRDAKFAAEDARVVDIAAGLRLTPAQRGTIENDAARLVEQVRARRGEHSVLDVFLKEFGLANEEGVALMCLAEALLRIPDAATVDALIADKILPGRWADHIGNSESTFVNASTWALMLTGRVIALDTIGSRSPIDVLGKLVGRAGEPVIRHAMRRAMRILGGEFVLGRDIEEALSRGADECGASGVFSFDMLGEGARTAHDAQSYFDAYAAALDRVGQVTAGRGPRFGSGISVKLSALHPRYEFAQRGRVFAELYPRLLELARRAAQWNIGMSIDAEEADRLELSLDLYERLAHAPELARWEGLGLVVQAYGKRALPIIDWLIELARDTGRVLSGTARQRRLLGCRDQTRAGERPGGFSGVYAKGEHRRCVPRLRAGIARSASVDLSPVRNAQRAHHHCGTRDRRRTRRISSFSGCMAWASCCIA